MATLVETQASQLARALADTVGYLLALTVRLYTTPIDVTPTVPIGTYEAAEATFTGYTAATVTWQLPTTADDGTVEVVSDAIIFRPTDAVHPNMIWGCFLVDTIPALDFAGQFDGAPMPMNSSLDQITLVVRYRPASDSLVVTIS